MTYDVIKIFKNFCQLQTPTYYILLERKFNSEQLFCLQFSLKMKPIKVTSLFLWRHQNQEIWRIQSVSSKQTTQKVFHAFALCYQDTRKTLYYWKLYIFLIVQYIANILLGITKERVLPFLHSSVVVLKYQWQKLIFQKFTNAGNISHSWQKMINLPTSTVY